MTKKTAGIILTSAFVMPGSNTYQAYLDYMERNEATRNEQFNRFNAFSTQNFMDSISAIDGGGEVMFSTYNDYMSNPEKTSALFTKNYDQTPENEVHRMKKYFSEAQENRSPLWQLVFSFRNEWLIEKGYLDEKTNHLKAQYIYQATRKAVAELEKKEGLKGEWTAAIHYNTDNLHVHVGYVEKEPTREWINYIHPTEPHKSGWQYKGKFAQKNITATKRAFVNELMQNKEQLLSLQTYLDYQKRLAESCQEQFTQGQYEQRFVQLMEKLPRNQYFWKYGFAERHHFKPELDRLIDLFLETDGKELMDKILPRLKQISDDYEEVYGNPRNKPTYYDQQLYGKNSLYSRIGNLILSEAKKHPELFRKTPRAASLSALIEEENRGRDSPNEQFLTEQQIVTEEGGFSEGYASLEASMPSEESESLIDVQSENPLSELSTNKEEWTEEEQRMFSSLEAEQPMDNEEEQITDQQTEPQKEETPLTQALGTLNRFFENREATREERNQNIILQMELEKETSIKEKRGVYFHKVNDEDLAEPVSIFEHGKLKKKIILPSNNRAEYVSMHEGPSKKIKSNLENYSSTNQRSILSQKPEATYVLGEERWQLKNRRIKESEKDKPILLVGLKKEGEESFRFEKKKVYDYSQTEEIPIKERKKDETIEKGVLSKKQPSAFRSTNVGFNKNHWKQSDYEFRKQMYHLRKACQNSLQNYLNEKAYRELEHSIGTEMIF